MKTLIKEMQGHIEKGINNILAGYEYKDPGAAPEITAPGLTLADTLVYSSPKDSQDLLARLNDEWEDILYLAFSEGISLSPETYDDIKAKFKDINARFKDANAKNKKTSAACMPHVNKPHWGFPKKEQTLPHDQGYCVYVGTCHENVKARMEQHIKVLSDSGIYYGLHLAEWWKNKNPVTFYVFTFKKPVSLPYLHQIEDILWDAYRPVFGKRGPR